MTDDGEIDRAAMTARLVARWWPDRPHLNGHAPMVGALPGTSPAYAKAAFESELAILAGATEGTRNDTLNRAAFNLAQLVASGHLPQDETVQGLYVVGLSTGLTASETRATLASAFRAGSEHPRAVPEPVTSTEVPEVTVLEVADLPADPAPQSIADQFPRLDWRALWDDDTAEEWVVEPLLPARRLVALFSPPKTGKSLLMLEIAVAVSRATRVLGVVPDRPRRVLYVDFENDPRGDVRQRLQAMGLKPDDLDNLVYLSFPRLPYLDTALGAATLLAVIEEYGVEVVVIDTISRAVGGEENDNDTWLSFYKNTGVALKARGVTCIRLDHTGKDPTKGMRGGSAKYGDVDAVWSMTERPGNVFRLECTAHRLPISEKEITIVRETEPTLHHRVAPDGWRVERDAEVAEIIKVIDTLADPDEYLTQKAIRDLIGRKASDPIVTRVARARALAHQVEANDPSWIQRLQADLDRNAKAAETRRANKQTALDIPTPGDPE